MHLVWCNTHARACHERYERERNVVVMSRWFSILSIGRAFSSSLLQQSKITALPRVGIEDKRLYEADFAELCIQRVLNLFLRFSLFACVIRNASDQYS